MIYECTLKMTLPVDATKQEVEEWLEFNLGIRNVMEGNNPLSHYDIEADSIHDILQVYF